MTWVFLAASTTSAVRASILQIVIWSGITGNGLVTAWIGFTVLVAAAVLLLPVRLARAGTQRPGLGTATGDTPARKSPDDDTSWKAGMFYVNPDDPSIFVPKRMGTGWTINLGRPAGVVIGVLTLILLAATIVYSSFQH